MKNKNKNLQTSMVSNKSKTSSRKRKQEIELYDIQEDDGGQIQTERQLLQNELRDKQNVSSLNQNNAKQIRQPKEEKGIFSCFKRNKKPNEEMPENISKRFHFGIKNTKEQSLRAQKNWKMLSDRVKEMKKEANYFVKELDNKELKAVENMNGVDHEDSEGQDRGNLAEAQQDKVDIDVPCISIIIQPAKSSWFSLWKGMILMVLFYGYIIYPIHICFVLSETVSTKQNRIVDKKDTSMTQEMIIDVLMMIDIIFQFITGFQKEGQWQLHIIDIIVNYAKGSMIFDMLSTLPGIITSQGHDYYIFKLIRFIHVREVYGFISNLFKKCLERMGLNNAATEKIAYIFNLNMGLFSGIHILACSWIYIGKTVPKSWIDNGRDFAIVNECNNRDTMTLTDPTQCDFIIDNADSEKIYVTSFYWVITSLTTVGYGDYKGYTTVEYMFQIFIEFLGIGVFSYLMNSINSLFGSEKSLTDILDSRIDKIEKWLQKLEKSRSKNFTKQMYDSIKIYTEQAFYFDYIRINEAEFFGQLKPKIRHRLIQTLCSPFISNFHFMFKDPIFEAGCEFRNDFMSNIYSRLYLPKNDVLNAGDNFTELIMIQQGLADVYINYNDSKREHNFNFFILPTFSYIGDYQILFDLRSQLSFKANKSSLLVTLCLKKKVFLQIIADYPEARRFYMERAWQRRMEFRRRQKKFLDSISLKFQEIDDPDNSMELEQCAHKVNQKHNEHDSEDSIEDKNNIDSETEKLMNKKHSLDAVNDSSKFFYDVDIENELVNDFDDEELEDISSDEFQEDTEHLLVENHKLISENHTKNLQKEIRFLVQSFEQMTTGVNSNLETLTDYIKTLQENKTPEQPADPNMIVLAKTVEDLRKSLFKKDLETLKSSVKKMQEIQEEKDPKSWTKDQEIAKLDQLIHELRFNLFQQNVPVNDIISENSRIGLEQKSFRDDEVSDGFSGTTSSLQSDSQY